MMEGILAMRGAMKVVQTCARVRRGERVLLITDPILGTVAEALAAAVRQVGAEPVMAVMEPRRWDGEEPPLPVAVGMRHADVVIFPTVRDIAHTDAVHEALRAGTRVVSMAGCHRDVLFGGGIEADFDTERARCLKMAQLLTDASMTRVLSPAGTDISLAVTGRRGNAHACVVEGPGQFTGVPNIEANVAPVEGSAEGMIVFDASVPNLWTGPLRSPVRLVVRSGGVVEVSGGREARLLEAMWVERKDPLVYNVAQLAIGMNPHIRLATGSIVSDHGIYGSVHFGIGTSRTIGGQVKASMHIDGILYDPTLELDGRVVLSNGEFRID